MAAKSPALLPREHGAYVQLGLALASGLVLGHGSWRAFAQALLTVLAFMASESLLLVLGARGDGARRQAFRGALRLLAGLGAPCLVLAPWIWWSGSWSTLAVPAALAAGLLALALKGREHTTTGELLAAWALASAALPVALLGGAARDAALLLAGALALIQTVGTATVRGLLASLRRKGHPLPRLVPALLGTALAGLAAPFAPILSLALLPGTLVASWVLAVPPRRMKVLGWTLAGASLLGTVPVLARLLTS